MTPEVRAFVELYAKKNKPHINFPHWIKTHNHEIWRRCYDCLEEWDARKDGLKCPKCGKEGKA